MQHPVRLALAALLGFFCMPILAEPAHYVVFRLAEDGTAVPLFHREVDMTIDHATPPPKALRTGADAPDRVTFRGLAHGYSRHVDIPRVLHAGFARDARTGLGEIDGREVANPSREFVVRVPVTEDVIEIDTGNGEPQRFDLAALAAHADSLPLAGRVPKPAHPRGARGTGGDPANRVDMLVFADGFTADQEDLFQAKTAALRDAFFAHSPYLEYENFVNWTPVFFVSQDEGATHPPYQPGCNSSSCCADASAQSDSLAGQVTDIAFASRFCVAQVHRLIVADYGLVMAAAADYPDWDVIIVSVNDPVYGGSGGAIGTISSHVQAPLVIVHEYGHTFTDLADEYDTAYPGFPTCSDIGGTACEANVTDQTLASQIKWAPLLTPGIDIPTPPGTPGTGLFEGARYISSGMYRPADQCMMRSLGPAFCAVCKQEYVRQIYRGWGGVPANGIDLIEPGSESPSSDAPVAYAVGSFMPFSADVLRPAGGSVTIEWRLDGTPIADAADADFLLSQASEFPVTRTLELRVTDTTDLVSPAMEDGLLTSTRSWTIHVTVADRIFADGFEQP